MNFKLKFRLCYAYWLLQTPLSPAPNFHDYAHLMRPGNQINYQQTKVGKQSTGIETSVWAQCVPPELLHHFCVSFWCPPWTLWALGRPCCCLVSPVTIGQTHTNQFGPGIFLNLVLFQAIWLLTEKARDQTVQSRKSPRQALIEALSSYHILSYTYQIFCDL